MEVTYDKKLERSDTKGVDEAFLQTPPCVFNYVNFRDFLRDSFQYKQKRRPSYSETTFVKQAGFGANSRGYFNLIVTGKRNLSMASINGFSETLKLNEKEQLYFENLVHYNQAKTEKDKTLYFEKMAKYIRGHENPAYLLLKSQYSYLANWYLIAIRELVAVDGFHESEEWINKKLRKSVSKKKIQQAIEDLLRLGLLKRDDRGALIQCEDFVRFSDDTLNHTVANRFHRQMLEKCLDAVESDPYEDRSRSCVVLACDANDFDKIREEIRLFRAQILSKYASNPQKTDALLNLGIQLFHLTPIKKKNERGPIS